MSASPKWAVITGASSGIGRALALEFASAGFAVFLTGRDAAALAAVAGECAQRFKAATCVVPADLSQPESVDRLIEELRAQPREVEVLANNAGFGIHGEFAATALDREIELLNVQLAAALKLTKEVLPAMIARGRGRILNVASVYSFAPVPFQSVYSACKAFLLSFSSSVNSELKGTGVTVTAFCPGITQTEFRARAGIREKQKDSGMTAERSARIACVATLRGTPVVVPGLVNRVFVLLSRLLPRAAFLEFVRFVNRQRGVSDKAG
jgi:short-subunit dehydrogenase